MKYLLRILLVLGLALPLGSRLNECKAQFVVSDPLSLGATLGQVAQDLTFDFAKWKDIAEKIEQVKQLNDILNAGKMAYTSINNIIKVSERIVKTGRKIESYAAYITSFDESSFRIDRVHIIYRQFMRKTNALVSDVESTIKLMGSFLNKETSPLDYLASMDELTSQLSDNIGTLEEQAISEVAEICREISISSIKQSNNAFKSLVIN